MYMLQVYSPRCVSPFSWPGLPWVRILVIHEMRGCHTEQLASDIPFYWDALYRLPACLSASIPVLVAGRRKAGVGVPPGHRPGGRPLGHAARARPRTRGVQRAGALCRGRAGGLLRLRVARADHPRCRRGLQQVRGATPGRTCLRPGGGRLPASGLPDGILQSVSIQGRLGACADASVCATGSVSRVPARTRPPRARRCRRPRCPPTPSARAWRQRGLAAPLTPRCAVSCL